MTYIGDPYSTTVPVPPCINCGFIGASIYVNGYGPYCGTCASKAQGCGCATFGSVDELLKDLHGDDKFHNEDGDDATK